MEAEKYKDAVIELWVRKTQESKPKLVIKIGEVKTLVNGDKVYDFGEGLNIH